VSISLPLTTMEEFLYWEDRPAYPWSCFARLRFSGCLDRTAFEAAVRVVLDRHPLLTAKVATGRRGRLRWASVENPAPIVKWESGLSNGGYPPATRLDLCEEIGIRFHVRTNSADSELIIQFHHVCCDGAGIAVVIRDLLVAYAMAFGSVPERTRLAALDPGRLAERGRFGLTARKLLRMVPDQLVGLRGARQFLSRRPAPVIPHRACPDDAPLPNNYPATVHRLLDRQSTAALRPAAMRLGVSTNDLLTRDLFLALAEWRSRQKIDDDGSWLRMMIPMNLRKTEDRLMPAANMVSSVFLDRRGPDFADADRLLHGIHEEMELIKRLQLGYTFIFSTALCRRFFGGLKKKVRADKCTISCIFTNLGNPFAHVPLPRNEECYAVGNATLENIDIVAPMRPYSCVTIAASLYAHKLNLTLHYDPRPLTEQQAAELMEIFVRRIEASIAGERSYNECPSAA
jgi:NRPS condensation-like uncharacterized protein